MRTLLTPVTAEAAEFIHGGGIVAFPTETVYGLGANVFDAAAIARIFEAKRRPQDNPLIAHIGEIDQLDQLADEIPAFAWDLIDTFFPGPLTLVLKKRDDVPLLATAGLETIGVRMPRHELARNFLKACGTPVVAPSANLSGRPSPTTWQAVFEDLDGRIDCILQGEATEIGLESTVVDCSGERPVILRQGAVTREQLSLIVPETSLSSGDPETAKSPGMKHGHYSPAARVVLISAGESIDDSESSAFIGLNEPKDRFGFERVVDDLNDYGHSLFEFFRECDRKGLAAIYCEAVPEVGIGAALMDRLRRAAQG